MTRTATAKEIAINVLALLSTLLILLLATALPYKAQAETFYVATVANCGDDGKTCQIGFPCATIQHVIDIATDGDVINVEVGDFTEDQIHVDEDGITYAQNCVTLVGLPNDQDVDINVVSDASSAFLSGWLLQRSETKPQAPA